MATVPPTYKAYRYETFGAIEDVLKLVDVKTAPLAASDVRIRVHSVALNPVDVLLASRLFFTTKPPSAEEPYGTCFDVAGVVVEVGSDATDEFQVGDQVYGMPGNTQFGTLAEYFVMDKQYVSHKPKTLDFDYAAAAPLVSLTSYQVLTKHTKTQRGERILILGGSSATGIFAVQYAKLLGAYVITTTSAKNVEFVKSLGADEVIDYTSQKWSEVLEAHSVDVIYDTVGEINAWNVGAQHILKKQTGRFVTIFDRGLIPNEAKFGASYAMILNNPNAHDLNGITKLIDAGKIKVFIDSVFPFDKATDAFTRIQTNRAVGKIIVKVL